MEETLTQILEQLQTNNKIVHSLEKRFDGFEEKFVGLENRFDGFEKRFDVLENRFDGLENEVGDLKTDVRELKQGQKEIRVEIKSLYDNTLHQIGDYTNHIDEYFDNRLNDLATTSNNQEKMIQTLASRSVKHESEINELKQKL